MTEKELLELAAKAAGMRLEWDVCTFPPPHECPVWFDDDGRGHWFMPRENDGDSLLLAVRCGMNIDIGRGPEAFTEASVIQEDMRIGSEEYHNGNPRAATRLAIFKTAVEIGKGMK